MLALALCLTQSFSTEETLAHRAPYSTQGLVCDPMLCVCTGQLVERFVWWMDVGEKMTLVKSNNISRAQLLHSFLLDLVIFWDGSVEGIWPAVFLFMKKVLRAYTGHMERMCTTCNNFGVQFLPRASREGQNCRKCLLFLVPFWSLLWTLRNGGADGRLLV